jgi:prepilin-type processing-associated H-X9-DG protein
MSNELNTPKILCCPQDPERWPAGPIGYGGFESGSPRGYFGNLVVSYFAGCNTAYDRPQMIVSGDRNIHGPTPTDSNDGYGFSPTNGSGARVVFGTNPAKVGWTSRIHRNLGNVAFADGSVQQLSSAGLLQAFANSGDTNTIPGANVIVFP